MLPPRFYDGKNVFENNSFGSRGYARLENAFPSGMRQTDGQHGVASPHAISSDRTKPNFVYVPPPVQSVSITPPPSTQDPPELLLEGDQSSTVNNMLSCCSFNQDRK